MVSRKKGDISPLEKEEAERALAFHNQRTSFCATLFQLKNHGRVNHDNALACLDPFLDAQGVIRLAGRTEAAPSFTKQSIWFCCTSNDCTTAIF
jgi:hypothetical protein